MVVRRYQARIDDASGCVDDLFTWLRGEIAHRRDPPVEDADRARGTHRIAQQASENPIRIADQC